MNTNPFPFKAQIVSEKENGEITTINVELPFIPNERTVIKGFKNDMIVKKITYNIIKNTFKIIVNEVRLLS